MKTNPATRGLGSRLGLSLASACILAAGLGLSACTQVDQMFGDDNEAAAPAPGQAATPRAQVRAASLRCDSITEQRAWLNCYYGAAQPVRADLGLPPAPMSQQNLVPPAR